MKKTLAIALIGLGGLLTLFASVNAANAPNAGHLVGTFLPGLFLLILGVGLWQRGTSVAVEGRGEAPQQAATGNTGQSDRFRTKANLGVVGGIVIMLISSAFASQGLAFLMVGAVASLAGWALMIWGCANYARWKGYSGWFGLVGYLLLPGLLILVCLSNRRKRLLQEQRPERIAEWEALTQYDGRSGARYLLALLPLAVVCVGVSGLMLARRSNIPATEWKEVAPAELGFRAIMPGAPNVDQQIQEAPGGSVRLDRFIVEPKGKRELFMIVSIRFPEESSRALGGTAKLLEIGRQDILHASQGQLKNERRIALAGYPGLEMEVLPPKGAIIKARIYAKENQIYQTSVHVPMIRVTSQDVQGFFDSFRLTAEPKDAGERG